MPLKSYRDSVSYEFLKKIKGEIEEKEYNSGSKWLKLLYFLLKEISFNICDEKM
jgi:hypothetical protein